MGNDGSTIIGLLWDTFVVFPYENPLEAAVIVGGVATVAMTQKWWSERQRRISAEGVIYRALFREMMDEAGLTWDDYDEWLHRWHEEMRPHRESIIAGLDCKHGK